MRDEVSIPAFRSGSVQAFKLDHTGLARLFGDLEARVMEIIWQLEEATVGDVLARLGGDPSTGPSTGSGGASGQGYHYNTVMTVMSRLADKGVLTRRREGRAHVYAPVEDRDAFLARVSREVAEGLLREFGTLAIAQFVDAADAVDPELLAELRRRIAEKTGESRSDG